MPNLDRQIQISLREVSKTYRLPAGELRALDGINLEVRTGECVAVVGKSGSGKSTLLNLLGGIDRPTSGEVVVTGVPIATLSADKLAAWRGRSLGFVFQFFQLLPTLTVAENVMLPMDFCGIYSTAARLPRAKELLDRVGIADQANKLPADLSGGQQQRAALARALANDPPLLLTDEPTGNLDSTTSDEVLELLAQLSREGKTILTVTHERDIDRFFTRTVVLKDGRVANEEAIAR